MALTVAKMFTLMIDQGTAVKPANPLLQTRRCWRSVTTDGTEYIAEFDEQQTAAVRHTVISPDGQRQEWPNDFTRS